MPGPGDPDEVEADLQELYVYPGRTPEGEDEDDLRELQDDLIDLEPVLQDTVVPRCRSSRCAGTTARVCAPSAGRGWRTTRPLARERSTRGGRSCNA